MVSRHKGPTKPTKPEKPRAKKTPPANAEKPEKPADAKLRQGHEPPCPYCKDEDGNPVITKAGKTEAFFTRYYCPADACTFVVKVPRPDLKARLDRDNAAEADFSAR